MVFSNWTVALSSVVFWASVPKKLLCVGYSLSLLIAIKNGTASSSLLDKWWTLISWLSSLFEKISYRDLASVPISNIKEHNGPKKLHYHRVQSCTHIEFRKVFCPMWSRLLSYIWLMEKWHSMPPLRWKGWCCQRAQHSGAGKDRVREVSIDSSSMTSSLRFHVECVYLIKQLLVLLQGVVNAFTLSSSSRHKNPGSTLRENSGAGADVDSEVFSQWTTSLRGWK